MEGSSMASGSASSRPSATPLVIRFAAYTGILLAGYAALPLIVERGGAAVVKEGGAAEWLQLLLLITTGGIFIAQGLRRRELRQYLFLLAAAAFLAAIRELDAVFDALLPYVGWQLPAAVVVAAGVIVVWRDPARFVAQAGAALAGRGATVLWSGFAIAIIFAQLVGHGELLEAVLEDHYMRDHKRVVEELGELFGYCLLLIGGVETVLESPAIALRVSSHDEQADPDPPGSI
jgi:hypothetical protein